MAIVSVYELWDGRTGNDTFTKRRTYTRVFEVYTNNALDNAAFVGSCPLLPRLLSSFPGDKAAVCVAVKPAQDTADPHRWIVGIEYDSQPEWPKAENPSKGDNKPETPENPLDRPPTWKFGFQQQQQVARSAFVTDAKGNLIPGSKGVLNSCDMPYDPPVMIDVATPVVTVTVNRPGIVAPALVELIDSVNKVKWQGFEARQMRCIAADAQSKFEQNLIYWELVYQFAFKFDTWDLRVLDAGYVEYWERPPDPITGEHFGKERRKIIDNWGREPSEAVPLNGFGVRQPIGDSPIFNVFRIYRERDFAKLIF